MENNPTRSVLILGARGRFGLAATRAFAASGWRVLAQIRPGATAPDCAGVAWLTLAVEDTAALVQAAAGASVVIHALNPPYTDWKTQAMPLLEAALRAARQLNARLMFAGNVYNFGSSMPPVLAEQTPQQAHTRKGKIRIAMEQQLQHVASLGQVRSVVIRAGDFFGSGTGSWFDLALAKDIRRGKMVYPGALDVPSAWTYLPDLANTFVRVADKLVHTPAQFAPFEVFHFQGYSLTGRAWAEQLEDVARNQGWLEPAQQLKIGYLPWPVIKICGLLVPMWRELIEMRYLWQTPHALAGGKLDALIGAEPHTPLSLAIHTALRDLGLAGRSGCAETSWA